MFIRGIVSLLAALALGVVAARPTPAEAGAGRSRVDDPPYFTVGAGAFDFEDEDTAADFRLEYRSDLRLLIFKPFIGLSGTSDSAVFLYGGLGLDLYVAPRWVITPNAAAGAFDEGDGKDLGGTLEFRTGVEIAYRFRNRVRLGLAVHHISNAGLASDDNPGANTIALYLSAPFDMLFGP